MRIFDRSILTETIGSSSSSSSNDDDDDDEQDYQDEEYEDRRGWLWQQTREGLTLVAMPSNDVTILRVAVAAATAAAGLLVTRIPL
ncbi:hypothetical protein M0802_000415 [Mischocyttarus mexicanus]|nr:hypothetical protein M0802_000415 [Mischocyttarus mexicanus]